MGWPSLVLHVAEATLSIVGGYHSYIAITNLQQYESMTKKAAKISSIADDQLDRTRKTHASGAISLLVSVVTSVSLAFDNTLSAQWRFVLSAANAAFLTGARLYMGDFWVEKSKVPIAQGYNQGIEYSKTVCTYLQYLAAVWALDSVVILL